MVLALYTRISEDPHGLKVGVTRQRTDTAALAHRRWPDEATELFEDDDSSAYSGKPRPRWLAMLDGIRAGRITGVIGYNLDRLVRLPRELESLIELANAHNLTRVVTAEGDIDLTTHDGQLQARILVAVAKKSSDDTSRRVKRAARDRAERGQWTGSCMPYPYRQRGGVVSFRSTVSRELATEACRMVLDGWPLRGILRWLVPLDPSAPRSPTGLRLALLSPALAGLNTDGIRGQWEPIVTVGQYAEIRALLTDPTRRTHPASRDRKYWLSGLVYCGVCNAPVRHHVEHDRPHNTYRCVNSCVYVSAPHLEATVAQLLFARAPLSPAPLPPIVLVESQSDDRLAELAGMYAAGELSRAEWVAARTAARAVPASSAPSPREDTPVLADDLRHSWDAQPDAHARHAIARRYLRRVVILPVTNPQSRGRYGGVFDYHRVVPEWL